MDNTVSEEDVRRLRWHCRRGLLENDLVLERYLARYADSLDRPRLTALARLLELGDPQLWDILSGRAPVREPQLAGVVAELRAV
jgi:succinate dehydrogenase flavin-adding protein (antitoxin of CptAB toxin-antitoxin module)